MKNNVLPKKRLVWNKGLTKSDPRVLKMYDGRNSWNKGLTKKTDERVNTAAISIQKSWNSKNIAQRSKTCKESMMKKYGVINVFQLESVKNKSKITTRKKYGVDYFTRTDAYICKSKKTKFEKYNDVFYNNPNKNKETCFKKYGVTNPNKLQSVRDKIAATNIKKYGVKYPYQNAQIKDKVKQTCINRYGVSSVMHLPEFIEKQQANSYKSKKYTLPSGKIIICQGYETFAIKTLLKQYLENDIVVGRTEIPAFFYFTSNNKRHIYYPDIFIKPTNTIIEVKSKWTNAIDPNLKLKEQAVLAGGYNFEKMIFNRKGELINE